MIRCRVLRGSSTAKWLTAVNRNHTTTSSNSSGHNGSAKSKPAASEKRASADEDIIAGEKNANVEDGQLERIQDVTPPSIQCKPRVLPLSPFMDPASIAAREKHHLPKLPPSKNPTLFQQQLAKNPYAQALATPVRLCQLTKSSQPSYFLQDFNVVAHPETSEPWWLPVSLKKKHEEKVTKGKDDKEEKNETGADGSVALDQDSELAPQDEEFDSALNPPNQTTPEISPSSAALPAQTPSLGPGTYILSRLALLSAMQSIRSGWGLQPYKGFSSGSIRDSSIGKKVRDRAVWRTDMDKFILELMRRRVVEGLMYLVGRKRGYVSGCMDWEDAKMASRQQALIMWTRKGGVEGEGQEVDGREKLETVPGEQETCGGPPEFATLTVGKDKPHMIPVHNLPILLGAEHLALLRQQCPIFEKELLIVKNKRNTTDIQMKLWKLQGYLAFAEPDYEKGFHEKWNRARNGLTGIPDEQQEARSRRWQGEGYEGFKEGDEGEKGERRERKVYETRVPSSVIMRMR